MKSPRRAFLGTLAAVPLAARPAASAEAQPPAPAAGGDAFADGLLAAARARYRLAPDEVEEVKKGIDEVLGAAERLRTVPLVNADEPVLTFEARPAALAGAGRPARERD